MDQSNEPVNDTVGPPNLYALMPLLALGIAAFVVRVWSRVRPTYRLNASDYACAVAVLSEAAASSCFAAAIGEGFGRHSVYVPSSQQSTVIHLLYISVIVGFISSALARISIAFLLLQFPISRTWKNVCWIFIALQAVLLLIIVVVQLAQCRPLRARWEIVPDGSCLGDSTMCIIDDVISGTGIIADVMSAVMPMFVIWKISRSTVERALVFFLFAMGILAAITTIINIIISNRQYSDYIRDTVQLYLCCRLQGVFIVLACSAPTLKSPFENFLHKLGVPQFRQRERDLNSIHSLRPAALSQFRDDRGEQEPSDVQETEASEEKPDGKLYTSSATLTSQAASGTLGYHEDSDRSSI